MITSLDICVPRCTTVPYLNPKPPGMTPCDTLLVRVRYERALLRGVQYGTILVRIYAQRRKDG